MLHKKVIQKIYYIHFATLEIHDLTKALQSTSFQNPEGRHTSITQETGQTQDGQSL